jgi:hypothetical protein
MLKKVCLIASVSLKKMVIFVCNKSMCVIATWFLCSLQHGMCVLVSEKNKNMSDRN